MTDRFSEIRSHAGYLVETSCDDGVRLNGFLQEGSISDRHDSLWIVVHGVAGNFYSSTLLGSIASTIRARGASTLRINTRGHDQIAFAVGSWPTLIGSAYEVIDEAQRDIKAWIAYSKSLGFQKVNVIAHSLGAIKSAYYAKQVVTSMDHGLVPDRSILLSPPRLRHESLREDPRHGKTYREDLDLATSFVKEGKGQELMQIKFPQPLIISAATFLDKYGKANRYDYLAWADEVPDADWIYGDLEVHGSRMNFANCDQMLAEKLGPQAASRIHVLANADHNYTNARLELSELLGSLIVA